MTTTQEIAVPTAVAEFLDRIGTADWAGMEDHLDSDVLYDGSVPGWHYQYQGSDRVLQEYREEWSGKYRWTVVERHTVAADDTVMLLIDDAAEPEVPAAHEDFVSPPAPGLRLHMSLEFLEWNAWMQYVSLVPGGTVRLTSGDDAVGDAGLA